MPTNAISRGDGVLEPHCIANKSDMLPNGSRIEGDHDLFR